jgi:hypothetical protein
MNPAVVVSVPDEIYLARLRALGAWWCLGSSALVPSTLMQYAPVAPTFLYEAGL